MFKERSFWNFIDDQLFHYIQYDALLNDLDLNSHIQNILQVSEAELSI